MSLQVSTLSTLDELRSVKDEWTRLFVRVGEDLPFLLPDWLIPWWGHFSQNRPLIRDSLHVKVVRRASGELVGVVPLMRTERPAIGPLRTRALQPLGADPYITEQPAPVLDPSCEADAGRAVARDLLGDPEWDWIGWQGLRPGSGFASGIEGEMALRWEAAQPSNVLRVGSSWDAFRGGLKRNIKESLRRCYNSLRRDGLSVHLVVAETPAEVAAALPTFLALHTMRANLTDTVAHPDRFAPRTPRRFLLDVCDAFARRGMARVFTLKLGGKPVACRIAFALPGSLYLYYSGFDPAWAKYSVMTTTVAEIIKHAIARGIPSVNLSMGADVSKSRWGPELRYYHNAVFVRPGLASTLAFEAQELARRARQSTAISDLFDRLLPRRRLD